MKRKTANFQPAPVNCRRRFVIALLMAAFFPFVAQAEDLRVRVMVGMEPIGQLAIGGLRGDGGDLVLNSGYGASLGLELLWLAHDRVEVGGGLRWEITRRLFRSGGSLNEKYTTIPVYAAVRVNLSKFGKFQPQVTVKTGYSVLLTTPEFRNALGVEAGDPPPLGGFYIAGGLGIAYPLVERSNWSMDLLVDSYYAYHGGTVTVGSKSHPLHYHTLSIDLSLDWRF